ncbi:MAG: hypothetical protein ACLTYW_02810 [Collinsella sp.]
MTSSRAVPRVDLLDYEFNEYRPSELVKLDILLSGDEVDALSFIVHKDKAYGLARGLRQAQGDYSASAVRGAHPGCIGNKIIARSTVKARRKDVLPSATAAIFAKRNCSRSRKRARSA